MSSEKNDSESGLSLPAYVLLRPEGVYINLSPLPPQDILRMFVDRLFGNNARFAGLDYDNFIKLLYCNDPAEVFKGQAEIKLADNIVQFPQDRIALYREVKIDLKGNTAEYLFEPVYMEVIVDGRAEFKPTKLEFDEFVAAMWLKGVKFGIEAATVRETIAKGAMARLAIANQRDPTDSIDAHIVEESDLLRQDNAPVIGPDGKADLRRARNRFPQVLKDTPLLRKVPRATGKPGYRVTGVLIEPRKPDDVDMSRLAGSGTRIMQGPQGELLASIMDGFICLDESTGQITIAEKIENKSGISVKETGDLVLAVDEYIEHGEVQEGRVVEGRHLKFLANVFGHVKASGDIDFARNLSGGSGLSAGGNISIKGRAINAVLEAWDGEIKTEFAEGCTVRGRAVTIKRAVNCVIAAEVVKLDIAEGCLVAGRSIALGSASNFRHQETIVSLLVPDLAATERQIADTNKEIEDTRQAIEARKSAAAKADPGFARYLAIAEKVKAGAIKFTPEQMTGWQKIVKQYAPEMKSTEALAQKCEQLAETVRRLTEKRASSGSGGEHCKIQNVKGDTIVRKLGSNLGMAYFRDMPLPELKELLKQFGDVEDRIFAGDSGTFDWLFTVPDSPGESA